MIVVALFCVGVGYVIGYLRGWMVGVERTRTYIDAPSQRAAADRRATASEELQPR